MFFVATGCDTAGRKYKVESMLAQLRGVARRHKAMGLTFVLLSAPMQATDGLVQQHIAAHGADALLPKSKEPLTRAKIVALFSFPHGTVVGGILVCDNLAWQGVRVWVALFATGGFRKEAVALGPGETLDAFKLTLADVVYTITAGVTTCAPSIEQLLAAGPGTTAYVLPCCCKNDPTDKKFCGHPVPSKWNADRPIHLCRELIKYKLMRRVAAAARRGESLVLGPSGGMWTKRKLDDFFKAAVALVTTPERANALSIHSFRSYLACALLAAGATPEQIMVMLRWSSEAARALYARIAVTAHARA
eukprot:2115730-Pleurochrysis_carterae.AAC.2